MYWQDINHRPVCPMQRVLLVMHITSETTVRDLRTIRNRTTRHNMYISSIARTNHMHPICQLLIPQTPQARTPTGLSPRRATRLNSGIPRALTSSHQRVSTDVSHPVPRAHVHALHRTDDYGRSIIRFAAARGNAGLLPPLLRHACSGIDRKERNTGTTPLHSAIMLGHSAAVRVLLDRGGSVTVADRRGWAALHWAVLAGDCGIVREVLHAEARLVTDHRMLGVGG